MAKPKLAGFHRRALMDDMMLVAGIDLLDAVDCDGGRSYVRARAACGGCQNEAVCREWLAGRSAERLEAFCPNAAFFRSVWRG